MRALRDLPIKRKLILMTMLTSGVALLIACLAFGTYELLVFRSGIVSDMSTSAAIVGDNSSAALTFNDPASAQQTLQSLSLHPHIVGAAIYDANDKVFATYLDGSVGAALEPPAAGADSYRFEGNYFYLFHRIELAGEHAGTVYVKSDLRELRTRMQRYAMIAALVMVAASVVAFLLSTRLQATISGPISQLATVMKAVATDKNYTVRAVKPSNDELGELIDGFNEMLNQIQQRETALQEASSTLEKRVEERTQELASSLGLLNATLESTTDGILAMQYSDGMICYNSKYQAMWNIPPHMLERNGASLEQISWTAAQVKNPEEYVAKIKRMRKMGEHESFDVLELKDGRIFERYTRPQLINGAVQGMVVNFRDITARKRAEDELITAHKQLLETSRLAGMAEVATGVLHNVGNVLNSVNVSANLIIESAKRSKAASLAKVAALLREHEHDLGVFIASDVKGRHLPVFLAQLSEHLLAEQQLTIKELDSLRSNIDHIKEIVSMQQSYSKVSGVKEVINVNDLVEDTIRMNSGALQRHGVEVVRELQEVPMLNLEKHKVLQILVNLVRNAKYACSDSGRREKRVTVRVANSDGHIRISVIDNGIGIAPENLTRIFSHGFTTRKDGHGFGLHSGALAARELGGFLRVDSPGTGLGASFTLELPLQGAEASHA
jgi:PAS domain S-box-containing protein